MSSVTIHSILTKPFELQVFVHLRDVGVAIDVFLSLDVRSSCDQRLADHVTPGLGGFLIAWVPPNHPISMFLRNKPSIWGFAILRNHHFIDKPTWREESKSSCMAFRSTSLAAGMWTPWDIQQDRAMHSGQVTQLLPWKLLSPNHYWCHPTMVQPWLLPAGLPCPGIQIKQFAIWEELQ